ncbi:MAG: phage terminase large subunit family protein [Candidatus Eiseniibacteriota bacterium]
MLAGDQQAVAESLAKLRSLRREVLRREVLDEGRIDLLATSILRYELRPFHAEMLAFQESTKDACLQLAPRGYGKSTILTIARAVFEILRNPNIRVLIASNTQLQAEVFLREIKFHLGVNERLIAAFGRYEDESKWDAREILVKPRTSSAKEATVTCVGVGGPVASRHYDLIIADDLVDEENARTEGQREKVRTWYYKTLLPCLEPEGRLFLVGTRYHYLDLYGHLIKNEFEERHQVIRAIDSDGATPWPEKFSIEWLEERRRQMGSAIFATQYQNDVELMKGDIFREAWFRYYEEQQEWELFEHWIGCDPAATKAEVVLSGRKAETDWWTIVVGARRKEEDASGGLGREVFIREVWRGRVAKQEYVNRLVAMNERYQPRRVIVEDVAAQEYLAQDLEKLMSVKRLKRTKDKVSRAYDLQGYFENGQILFPAPHLQLDREAYTALQDELILFPNADHDDLIDGLQTAVEGAFDRSGECGVWIFGADPVEEYDPYPWARHRITWPFWGR